MLVVVVALTLSAAPSGALRLSPFPSEPELSSLLWEHSPELQSARGKVAQARGDYERANLLPNPGLDVSMNTIPVGPLNTTFDPTLTNPWDVPNYGIGISELVELGKRGPRQLATRRALDAAILDARELLRQRYYDLSEHLGEIAAAEARISELKQVADGAHHMTIIQKARADRGEAVPLDADRTLLEEEKLRAAVGQEQEHMLVELRACTELLGVLCEPFDNADQAAEFLDRPVAQAAPKLEERPDIQSLQAQEESALAFKTLGERKAIPDPTFRLGYVRDQFVASGNQQNSLYVGVSLPLPVFDHGQVDARAAAAAADAAARARARTLDAAKVSIARIVQQQKSIDERRAHLRGTALPLARDVVSRLDQALARGGIAVQDLILSRRTLAELLIDARDLDLESFRNGVAALRTGGATPAMPPELNTEAP
jgi:cobalt-zinc-cadmium efflux system outer membrane protein